MMLGNTGGFAAAAGRLSARSYVQDGLIAMWDGTENAGWGAHDSSFVGMVNLCGNGCDLANVTNGQMTENCIMADPATSSICFIESVGGSAPLVTKFLNASKAYSFEIVGSGFGVRGIADIFLTSRVAGSGISVYMNSAYGRGSIIVRSSYLFVPGGWLTNGSLGDGFATHTRVADSGSYRNYINGAVKQSSDTSGADFRYTTAKYANAGNVSFTTGRKLYNARLYDRKLSDSEVAANYAIDKERFN